MGPLEQRVSKVVEASAYPPSCAPTQTALPRLAARALFRPRRHRSHRHSVWVITGNAYSLHLCPRLKRCRHDRPADAHAIRATQFDWCEVRRRRIAKTACWLAWSSVYIGESRNTQPILILPASGVLDGENCILLPTVAAKGQSLIVFARMGLECHGRQSGCLPYLRRFLADDPRLCCFLQRAK